MRRPKHAERGCRPPPHAARPGRGARTIAHRLHGRLLLRRLSLHQQIPLQEPHERRLAVTISQPGAPALSDSPPSQFKSGLVFGLIAYLCWGAVPLYFAEVKGVPALEILSHRIAWSFPLMLVVVALTPGGATALGAVLRSPRLLLLLLTSALFLSVNWLLYIHATVTGRVAEASLGYYMMPLVNAFLATVFLGERLRPLHYPALALIALGCAIPMASIESHMESSCIPFRWGK